MQREGDNGATECHCMTVYITNKFYTPIYSCMQNQSIY